MSKITDSGGNGEKTNVFTRIATNLFRAAPSKRYYACVKVGGKQFRQSLRTTDRQLAQNRLKAFLERHARLRAGAAKWSFGDLSDLFVKTVLAARDLKPSSRAYAEACITALFREWPGLRKLPLRTITLADCERWFARRKKTAGAQLINNELGALKQVLEFGVREGALLENPAKSLRRTKIPKPDLAIPTRQEFTRLVAQLRKMGNDPAADFVELLAYSGMRRNEAASLTWGDIDERRGTFRVTGGEQGTKNRRIRHVPLFPSLKELLERIRLNSEETGSGDTVVTVRECRGGIASACKAAELPHFSHHSMRHFFTSNAIEAGLDFKVISDWLGHLDGGLLVAKTYGHLRQEHSMQMATKMTFSAVPDAP